MAADPSSGEIIPVLYLAGTSYAWPAGLNLESFRVLEDGTVELLLADRNGLNCRLDKIRMQKTEKIPIVVRSGDRVNDVFRELVSLFNMENSTYQVIIEDCTDPEALEDFARLTSVQMNAGKGPDILYGDDLMADYIAGMLEKGALEDMKPYMEKDGIREEDYFPLTFSVWRQCALFLRLGGSGGRGQGDFRMSVRRRLPCGDWYMVYSGNECKLIP